MIIADSRAPLLANFSSGNMVNSLCLFGFFVLRLFDEFVQLSVDVIRYTERDRVKRKTNKKSLEKQEGFLL
jgi:hypothetical protein